MPNSHIDPIGDPGFPHGMLPRAGREGRSSMAWPALFVLVIASVGFGAEPPDRHADLTRLSPTEEIWIDVRQKAVVIGGRVVMAAGAVELFACPRGTKEHESIVAVNASTRLVHAGLLAIGLEPGTPVSFDPDYEPATGPRVRVQVAWKDEEGNVRKADARDWIREARTGEQLGEGWVFAGGAFWTDPDTGTAKLLGDGADLVCVSNFPTALLDLRVKSPQSNDALRFEAFEGRVPAPGTAVDILLSPARVDLATRASEIDPDAREHPEIDFVFTDDRGRPRDLEHAVVDTGVASRGKLVIWLMDHSPQLFDRIAGCGLHGIQVAYANRWFGKLDPAIRDSGDVLGKIRLEAATGEDVSPLVEIPKPDGMKERARRFLSWLDREHPAGYWGQFLVEDRSDLRWEKVILAGISHGATTAARFALHQRVDRVVMFSGPRDNTETWQGLPSATPSNRFFGFSHVLDAGWAADHYCRSWQLLRMHEHGPVVDVDRTPPPFENSRRLITACDVGGNAGRAHGAVIPGVASCRAATGAFVHEPVWEYLFTHPVEEVGDPVPPDPQCAMERQHSQGVP